MNVNQFVVEMRGFGYRFYVTPHPIKGSTGIPTMFPNKPPNAKAQERILELETWRSRHASKEQLLAAIVAFDLVKPNQQESKS